MTTQAIDTRKAALKAALEEDPTQWEAYKNLAHWQPTPAKKAHMFLKGAWYALAIGAYREAEDLSFAAQVSDGTTFSNRLIDLELLRRQGKESEIPKKLLEIAGVFERSRLFAEELKARKMLARISADPLDYQRVIDLYKVLGKDEKAAQWKKDLPQLEESSRRKPLDYSGISETPDELRDDPPKKSVSVEEVIGAIRWFSDDIVYFEFIDPVMKEVQPDQDRIEPFARRFEKFVATKADGPSRLIKALQAKNLAGLTDAFLRVLVRDGAISKEDIPDHVKRELWALGTIGDIQRFENGEVYLMGVDPGTKKVYRDKGDIRDFAKNFEKLIRDNPTTKYKIGAALRAKSLPGLTRAFFAAL